MEFVWGNILAEVMGDNEIKASGIHYGTVWSAIYVANDMIDNLEGWFLLDRSMA